MDPEPKGYVLKNSKCEGYGWTSWLKVKEDIKIAEPTATGWRF